MSSFILCPLSVHFPLPLPAQQSPKGSCPHLLHLYSTHNSCGFFFSFAIFKTGFLPPTGFLRFVPFALPSFISWKSDILEKRQRPCIKAPYCASKHLRVFPSFLLEYTDGATWDHVSRLPTAPTNIYAHFHFSFLKIYRWGYLGPCIKAPYCTSKH